MRWAQSYSIIDHHLLHGGYLQRIRHESMIVYLFLVVVSDREGKSFYADTTISGIVRLTDQQLQAARSELLREALIDYRRPYWILKNITQPNERKAYEHGTRRATNTDNPSARRNETLFSPDRSKARNLAKKYIHDILRKLQ